MPCRYDETPEEKAAAVLARCNEVVTETDAYRSLLGKLSTVTRLLCAACQKMERNKIPIDRELLGWWNQHQKEDKEREAKEAVEKARKKQAALGKLTAEEKELLGLK